MKDIFLLGKKILFDKSPVVFKYIPDENWEKFWKKGILVVYYFLVKDLKKM